MEELRRPHKGPQTTALMKREFEVLYGGARGGGKTDCGMAWLLYDINHPQFKALVVRRNADDLKDWIDRARHMYRNTGAVFTGATTEIRFPSGAVIRTGHLKDDNAYTKYQGHEYHRILIEELTHIPSEENYLKLISSCRSTIPELRPQVFATTNPGGIGHSWVKKRFVDVALPGSKYTDPITGRDRIFIPAKVEDNPTLMINDPDYVKFLNGLPEDLRKAWRDGSRDVFDTKGSFYSSYIRTAREQNRICKGLYEQTLDIYTFRDIGINDETVGIVAQFFGKEIRVIDCIYGTDFGLDHYINILKEKGYFNGKHYFPHDIEVRELTNRGQTRKSRLENLGMKVQVSPKVSVEDGINKARIIFGKIRFEEDKTDKLLEALNIYRKKRDDKNQVFGDPIHDWSSNFADALRYLAVNYDKIVTPANLGGKDLTKTQRMKYNPILGEYIKI